MNPVAEIKNNLSVGKIVGFVVVGLVTFAIFEVLGITPFILTPVSAIKNKFFNKGGG